MTTDTKTPVSCLTCLYAFTHEACDGCLHTAEDYAAYRTCGRMAPFRYLHHVPSDPLSILTHLHDMQLSGKRCITLGDGEADIYATSSPEETSKHLHYVACECGYICHQLQKDAFGNTTLRLDKDGGPYQMLWKDGVLMRVLEGGAIFWKREGVI